jgi:phosphate-selective porin OprO and OprP
MLAIAALLAWAGSSARAQSTPSQEPFGSKPAARPAQAPAVPSPAVPPPAAVPTSREAELEARLKQMEAMVARLSKQVDQLSSGGAAPAAGVAVGESPPGTPGGGVTNPNAGPGNAMAATPSASGGANAPGQSLPPNPPPSTRFQVPATLDNKPAKVKFGPGFEIRSEDDEYIFQFHNLTQLDYRGYQQGGQNPVHDTFAIPRQWWMFSGRVGKQWGYFVSFQNGLDTVSGLDMFVDWSYDPKFQIRAGRFKTPFTYEFLVEPIQGLFFNNFGQNRDVGVMAFGRLLDKKVDYAAGIFNGNRNGYLAPTDSKTVSGFINYKPFGDEENTLLENFNIGGSVFTGNASNVANPQTLRTAIATSGNQVIGTPFLSFNNNVRESGPRTFWDLHMAYFYNHLSLIAEWGSGYQEYAPATQLSNRTRVNVQSFYVQSGYFLTGETASGTGVAKPLRPFNLKHGDSFGLGAFELQGRYAYMDLGNNVFSNGLADPNLWTNRLFVTDLGVNWYLTQYVKVMLDWQHSGFGDPVQFAPGRRQLTSDMFMLRFQLYF